jgi:hypothetical protein
MSAAGPLAVDTGGAGPSGGEARDARSRRGNP